MTSQKRTDMKIKNLFLRGRGELKRVESEGQVCESDDANIKGVLTMSGPARAGALIYAKDPVLLTHFYRTLLQMEIRSQRDQLIVLENGDIQLLLHAIPEPYAEQVLIKTPPELREAGAIKLFFTVASLAWAEAKAADLGGGLLPQQWSGPGFVVRNAFDPEGNILQLRELRSAADPL